jgi:hypothetical protein
VGPGFDLPCDERRTPEDADQPRQRQEEGNEECKPPVEGFELVDDAATLARAARQDAMPRLRYSCAKPIPVTAIQAAITARTPVAAVIWERC